MTLSTLLDGTLEGRRPSDIVYISVATLVAAKVLADIFSDGFLLKRLNLAKWGVVRAVAAPIIQREVKKTAKMFKMPAKESEFKAKKLPEKATTDENVLSIVHTLHKDLDKPYEMGSLSGAVYHGGASHTALINRVMEVFQWSNPLHCDVFGATRKMEAEVVSMVVHMFNGHFLPDACGTVTSGGTESILMAMKSYRGWGRARRGIEHPSVVVGITAHPAFDKAAEYFGITLIKIPVDPVTQRINAKEVEKYIKHNTVAIVGSAPTFPHGVVDPISELSEVACRHEVGLHVDCCLGGFIVPFMEKAGFSAPIVDFCLPGVTTISCDTHKYGYAPKGTSTVLYRTRELRSFQFCCVAEWPGGIYCSSAVSGSKPGNVIAGAWAAMVRMGEEGYVDNCRKIMETRMKITSALCKLPYISIIGDPTTSVFAFNSDYIDIYVLGDRLGERGWVLNRLQFPSGLQFSVTLLQTQEGVADRFIHDLTDIGDEMYGAVKQAEEEGRNIKRGETGATVYGLQQRLGDRSIVKDVLREFLNQYYSVDH
ncbi:putative sphingosine 1-phosphate lyase [Trypanosoma rangeli]|uniref:sphinganine-1-phosphate aldolase n=1 Tax=Trypanosoma rangeli TaxID=5698 RepID=A0A3R7KL89_TRYRA|nr:putative sphingosine 1-phosphate lyase [Trypanosoma rangeli]RNF09730.1 putative sphingosine 1-phosphate lyase [Trypanosoma rangeli]|eukprot:RNF09730.1 putative sphingosine 1-phosphate lyase [Trypanosoma rangeli]